MINKIKILVFVLHLVILLFGCTVEPEKYMGFKMKAEAYEISEKPFANPSNIYGSSFGQYFQGLYRNNKLKLMCDFTSRKALDSIGRGSLLFFYKNNFQFDFNLGPLSNITTIGDTIQLTYASASIEATRRKIILNCILENDTVKLIPPFP